MPFTFSHPAIVLPLVYLPKRWYSISALVIGSFIPDFEYFFRMEIRSDYSHTLSGIFWFDWPIGFLTVLIFHVVVRNVLFNNLPLLLKKRFLPLMPQESTGVYLRRRWVVLLFSVFVGAVSHVFWDSFTHHGGYFVEMIPTLNEDFRVIGYQTYFYKVLQHLSTFIGGLAIFYAISNIKPDNSAKPTAKRGYWIMFLTIVTLIVLTRLVYLVRIPAFGNLLVTVISATLLSLIITSFIYPNFKQKGR